MKSFPKVAIFIVLLSLMFAVIVTEANTTPPVTTPGTEIWTGNGDENNCESGGTYHWILTAGGGKDFEVLTATLYVTYEGGATDSVAGYRPGNGGGAMHFDITGGEVDSAYTTYTYTGTPGNLVLTISHSTCRVTNTTDPPTTTTSSTTTTSTTSTTEPPTTTTSSTSTTTTSSTTSTTEQVTTTTVPQTTTTIPETTTTTVPETTTTTVPETTTTTEQVTTTTTVPNTTTTTEPPAGGGTTTTTVAPVTTTTDPPVRTEYPFTGAGEWALAFVVIGLAAVSIGYLLWRSER